MIRNWDKLPQRTRAAYLQEANKSGQRLIAGQEKTMKTMRTKYLANIGSHANPHDAISHDQFAKDYLKSC